MLKNKKNMGLPSSAPLPTLFSQNERDFVYTQCTRRRAHLFYLTVVKTIWCKHLLLKAKKVGSFCYYVIAFCSIAAAAAEGGGRESNPSAVVQEVKRWLIDAPKSARAHVAERRPPSV